MDQKRIDALRGHKFLPASARDIPALDTDAEGALDDVTIHLRYFTNVGAAYWLVAQYDPATKIAWGYAEVTPGFGEWGSFSLRELRELYLVKSGFPIIVERDRMFAPTRFGDIERP
ncbi:MAG TPA: DUF2958 domain-containing protein [Rhodoglobus sp.]|nr:DUF2958 domain-containing protein [Rhodoglobus sp.]